MTDPDLVATQLAQLYDRAFGGKPRGRFRVAAKHLRQMAGVRRLYEADTRRIGRALYEHGFTLIDMETYFVVISHKTFASYRRVNEESLR